MTQTNKLLNGELGIKKAIGNKKKNEQINVQKNNETVEGSLGINHKY